MCATRQLRNGWLRASVRVASRSLDGMCSLCHFMPSVSHVLLSDARHAHVELAVRECGCKGPIFTDWRRPDAR